MPYAEQSSPHDELRHFRAKRMRQLLYITLSCVNFGFIAIYFMAFHYVTLLTLAGIDIMLLYALLTLDAGRIDRAASVLLWSIAVGLSIAVTANSGLRDPAIIAFPAILFFAALVCSKKEFGLLYLFFCTVTILIGLTHLSGLRDQSHDPVNWPNIVIVLLILTAASFSIRIHAFDLRRALDNLEKKNRRLEESEAKALYLAQYDYLTGLPNRILCEDRFNTQLHLIQRTRQKCALLFIDLDNFKTINDSLGHSAGDQVLRIVANNLAHCLRDIDTACRFGGDEFIVILSNIEPLHDVEKISKKILASITQSIQLENHQINTTASIGIVIAPQDGTDFESYCKNADIAMYRAKAEGKNLYRFFDATMNTLSQERFVLIKDLRNALGKRELQLFYQPKIDLASGAIVGAEALLRWQHPERGLLAPNAFIHLAEETGLIVEIGNWVLAEACRQCKTWHNAGFPNLHIAVNLSPIQFARGSLTEQVCRALSDAQLDGSYLELELTESLLLGDAKNVSEQIAYLRKSGISFSIDDFGTGYSNLGYLSKFDLEALKIDQSFVRKVLGSKQDLNIVIAIVNIAKSLGLTTVAEGIEDAQTLAQLAALDCSLGQGYYWSRPLPATAFSNFIESCSGTTTNPAQSAQAQCNK